MITIIQLMLSIWLIAKATFIPGKYLVLIVCILFGVFAFTFSMQFIKGKGKQILGGIISVITSIILVLGLFGIHKMNSFINAIGSDGLKITNMVVAVRIDNPAENIFDASNYDFGIQTSIDKDNTSKMVDELEGIFEKNIDPKRFETIEELSQTLLKDDVDAIIYNAAFTDIIEEYFPDYLDRVKIIHQYGIEIKLDDKEKVNVGESFNIYISGIDVSGPISTTSRSDVNIIMIVNTDTKQILLTTTPRDYFVPIPEISGGVRDKLTHAGVYGVYASIRTLEELYGIDISYYSKVNFSSLIKIVDLLGGVDVYSKYEFTLLHGKDFHFVEGMNHMNGDQALAFSRERYSFQEGDNQRGKNQEAVIEAIINKAMTPAILKDAGKIIESVSDSAQTNMGNDQIKKLINMQLQDNAKWSIESQAVTGFGDMNFCFSSGNQQLYVMNPDIDSDIAAKNNIDKVLKK